jgi:hypothetical protein
VNRKCDRTKIQPGGAVRASTKSADLLEADEGCLGRHRTIGQTFGAGEPGSLGASEGWRSGVEVSTFFCHAIATSLVGWRYTLFPLNLVELAPSLSRKHCTKYEERRLMKDRGWSVDRIVIIEYVCTRSLPILLSFRFSH